MAVSALLAPLVELSYRGGLQVEFGDRAPYLAWVWAVDRVAGWSGGAATSDRALLDRVTEAIYRSGLTYDRQGGAPAYSTGTPYASTVAVCAWHALSADYLSRSRQAPYCSIDRRTGAGSRSLALHALAAQRAAAIPAA